MPSKKKKYSKQFKRRKKFTPEIEYTYRPYSSGDMVKRETEYATSLSSAKKWVKTISKDPTVIKSSIQIREMEKTF